MFTSYLDTSPYSVLYDFINITENQGNTFACKEVENKDQKKLLVIFMKECISIERFEVINTIKNSTSYVDDVNNCISTLIPNFTVAYCEENI